MQRKRPKRPIEVNSECDAPPEKRTRIVATEEGGSSLNIHPMDQFVVKPLFGGGGGGHVLRARLLDALR